MPTKTIYNLATFTTGTIDQFKDIGLTKDNQLDFSLIHPIPDTLKGVVRNQELMTNFEIDILEVLKEKGITTTKEIRNNLNPLFEIYNTYFAYAILHNMDIVAYFSGIIEKYENFDFEKFQDKRKPGFAINNLRNFRCLTEADYENINWGCRSNAINTKIIDEKNIYFETQDSCPIEYLRHVFKKLRNENIHCEIKVSYCEDDPNGMLGTVFTGYNGFVEIYDLNIDTDDTYLKNCKFVNKIKGLPDTDQYAIESHLEKIDFQYLKDNPSESTLEYLTKRYGKTIGTAVYEKCCM